MEQPPQSRKRKFFTDINITDEDQYHDDLAMAIAVGEAEREAIKQSIQKMISSSDFEFGDDDYLKTLLLPNSEDDLILALAAGTDVGVKGAFAPHPHTSSH